MRGTAPSAASARTRCRSWWPALASATPAHRVARGIERRRADRGVRADAYPGVTLCIDDSSGMRLAAQSLGVKHVALVTARNQRKRGIYHVQTVNSYQGRLKAWIARFRGVATKYLDRYLTWHIIDERVQRLTAAKARAVLVGNTAELRPDRCCPNCGAMLCAA